MHPSQKRAPRQENLIQTQEKCPSVVPIEELTAQGPWLPPHGVPEPGRRAGHSSGHLSEQAGLVP